MADGEHRRTVAKVLGVHVKTSPAGSGPPNGLIGPQDFLATIYRHLGIDYSSATVPDRTGRPVPIVDNGTAVPELSPNG